MIHKSNCKFCVGGIVLDEKCEMVIGHCYCDIDQYDKEIGCNRNCYGYSVKNGVKRVDATLHKAANTNNNNNEEVR